MLKIVVRVAAFMLLLSTQQAWAGKKVTKPIDPVAVVLDRVAVAAKCVDSISPMRVWCLASGWAEGTAPALPKDTVLLGLTLEVTDQGDVGKALINGVSVSAVAFGGRSEIKVTTLKPSNDAEKQQMGEVVASLAAFFKTKTDSVAIPADLAGYLKTLQGSYKTKKVGAAWRWKGTAQGYAKKFGENWIVIEKSTQGPACWWISIVTTTWK